MSNYTPDRWVLTTMTYPGGEVADRVFAGWYGGYCGSDSWKLSSGVTELKDMGEYFEATNISGSVYKLYKSAEGMSGYMTQMWETFQRAVIQDPICKLVLKEIQT